LQFIEKMTNAEGVHKKIKNSRDLSNSIKCNLLEKKDILEPFKQKFSWYFKKKYQSIEKKKNFDEIMDMSSVWTNSSQIE
jgi:hemerythrin superfamily protein